MEKIEKINIKDVSKDKKLLLEGKEDFLEVIGKAKDYINEGMKGKDAEITIEGGKITFVKTLGGGSGNGSDGELNKLLTHLNWNIGSIALSIKMGLLYNMSRKKEGKEYRETENKIYDFFKKDLEKNLKYLNEIKEEQEKSQ